LVRDGVCYILGIMSTDPETNDLLFERFVSRARRSSLVAAGATDGAVAEAGRQRRRL
jgi:hypothetical protein